MSDTIDRARSLISGASHLVVLTGAGISAESGIPTFRGADGFWRVGSKNYHPQQMATYRAFCAMPEEIWKWYLYRLDLCKNAKPNAGHRAIVKLEKSFERAGKQFHLVTQNVDGLHLEAGSDPATTYQVHGNIHFIRCAKECSPDIHPLAKQNAGVPLCPQCGGFARPHVLWFDEMYDEKNYKYETVLTLSQKLDVLLIVGTTLQTSLPALLVSAAIKRGVPVIDINPEPAGLDGDRVIQISGKAAEILPEILEG